MLNQEQHRRLIGNDVAVILFQETDRLSNVHIDPSLIDLGQVTQMFGVVQPRTEKRRNIL